MLLQCSKLILETNNRGNNMTTATQRFTKEEQKEIAATILQQLGGNKFLVMTGAKDLAFFDGGLQFKIGRNGSKANIVSIELTPADLYKVTFFQFRKMELKELKVVDGVFFDMLQEIFTDYTGLYTSL